MQSAATTAAQREVAKKERQRLKQQGIAKKQQLDKLREQQNTDAAAGDVSCCRTHFAHCILMHDLTFLLKPTVHLTMAPKPLQSLCDRPWVLLPQTEDLAG